MPAEDAPRPAPQGNNRDVLNTLSSAQRAVATGGKVPSEAKLAKDLDKAAEPTKPPAQTSQATKSA